MFKIISGPKGEFEKELNKYNPVIYGYTFNVTHIPEGVWDSEEQIITHYIYHVIIYIEDKKED